MTLVWSPGYGGAAVSDPDAMAYLRAVEVADNQALEQGVQQAVNQFVVGCKADGIWNAIKASCILSGARTLAGSLVPLVGTAPTNFNFVSGDYNRKTGLVGDGSTKYLNSNRADNSDPQNNNHLSTYITALATLTDRVTIGSLGYGVSAANNIFYRISDSSWYVLPRNSVNFAIRPLSGPANLVGYSRATSSVITFRSSNGSTSSSINSDGPVSNTIHVFSLNPLAAYSDARIAFYSIGESLDLALLDARVTALINAFAAAIP
jgi:hypothetical protein